MTGGGDLVVVVPRRFDQRRIPAIVEAKLPWIERARTRVEARRAAAAAAALEEPSLPERISLPAMSEEWLVEYRATRGATGRAAAREGSGGRLVVTAPAGDEEAARRALLAWARRRAAEELPARLEDLAALHGFDYDRVIHQAPTDPLGELLAAGRHLAESASALPRARTDRPRAPSRTLPHPGDEPLEALLDAAGEAGSRLRGASAPDARGLARPSPVAAGRGRLGVSLSDAADRGRWTPVSVRDTIRQPLNEPREAERSF